MHKGFLIFTFSLIFIIAGCAQPASPTPTETPKALLPSPTLPCVNDPFCQPTATPTPLPTAAPSLFVMLEGCDWGIDIKHGMGEVTNAYLLAQNPGTNPIHDLCLELSASDEGREHPDKSRCFLELPPGKQVAVKLTVDTTYGTNTDYQVVITSAETTLYIPTQRCQPLKDGVKIAYDRVLDVIQDIGK